MPDTLITTLLDEIKLRRPSASVKGTIWHLVGILHAKYEASVSEHLVESQDVMFQMLEETITSTKPEIKAIIGMLKGF